MSADNGYVIQQTAEGKYTLQSFFGSSEEYPSPEECPSRFQFDTLEEATEAYRKEEGHDGFWSEYGLRFNLLRTVTREPTFYEKLYALVETCSRCGKREYTIESSSLGGRKTHYSLITCPITGCEEHCHCSV